MISRLVVFLINILFLFYFIPAGAQENNTADMDSVPDTGILIKTGETDRLQDNIKYSFGADCYLSANYYRSGKVDPQGDTPDFSEFTVERMYLTGRAELYDMFSFRTTFDFDSSGGTGFLSILKYAYIDYKVPNSSEYFKTNITFGQQQVLDYKFAVAYWNHRVLGAEFVDAFHWVSSTDRGISIISRPLPGLAAGAGLYNGSGYKNRENDTSKDFVVSLEAGLFEMIRGQEKLKSRGDLSIKLFGSFRSNTSGKINGTDTGVDSFSFWLATGALGLCHEYFDAFAGLGKGYYNPPGENDMERDSWGISSMLTFKIFPQKFHLFGRYDYIDFVSLKTLQMNDKLHAEHRSWAGIDFFPIPNIDLILAYRHTVYKNPISPYPDISNINLSVQLVL